MALTVEDGTNIAGADTYVDTAFVDAYAAARGRSDWAKLGGTAKEVAIRVAQEFMFVEYSDRWKGERANDGQALDWPRDDVYGRDGVEIANNVIPDDIKAAQAEYALIEAIGGGLFFEPPVSDTGQAIREIEQKADVVMQRIQYQEGARQATRKRFPKADGLVRFYLRSASGFAIRL